MSNPSSADAPEPSPLSPFHAIVTGGGRGIGAATARRLAQLGARVTVMGRTETTLEATAAALRQESGVEAAAVTLDVTRPEAIGRAFQAAAEAFGPPGILVNNAGGASSAPLGRTSLEMWNHMLELNATSALLCSQAVLPAMVEAGQGRIVNVASTAGLKGYAYVSAYCASKHALIGLTRSLALETARKGVTVNAVCPGYTDTDLVAGAIGNITEKTGISPEEARASLESHNPQGRLVQPGEVAEVIGWLCLPGQRSVTGQSLVIAGGEVM